MSLQLHFKSLQEAAIAFQELIVFRFFCAAKEDRLCHV
jgi:hypothetical protein